MHLRRRFFRLGKGFEAEHLERAPQQIVVAPLVHDRERLGRVEVVVQRGSKPLPGSSRRSL
jgi:hypothetical protein